jgi:chitodextrinase
MESTVKITSRALAVTASLTLLVVGFAPAAGAAPVTPGGYPYDQPGDKQYVSNTNVLERFSPEGANNQSYKVTAPRAQADAAFTSEAIAVDGVRDAAWDAATPYPIGNSFTPAMTADAPDATTSGTLRLLWDGPVLYALVEVSGDATKSDTGTPSWTSGAYTPTTDGLFVFMDVFNDQWGLETDTQGVFFLGANPALTSVTSFNNGGIPSLGSFFNAGNQDYSTRLKGFKSSGYSAGSGVSYTYEVALQVEGWGDAWDHELANGAQVGLEVGVFDQGQSFTYWSKTQSFAGREGSSNLPNSERVRNRDWGVVTLAGWDGEAPFAYSGWRADEDIRFWNSKNNPGGSGNGTAPTNDGDGSLVWTAQSKARMVAAKAAYLAVRDSATATRGEKEAAVREVCEAFAALRWADTRYPDPHDLPVLQTLPNAFTFFDPTKGTGGMVTDAAQWAERKQEILDLAQFYEYGYKPRLGVDYTVNLLTNAYSGSGNAVVTAQVVPTNANFAGGVPVNVTVSVTLPAAVPDGQKAAVAFGGGYTANGIANVGFPSWAFDNRTDNGAWGNPNRTGTFYTLFPYARNSTSADSSILIANATAVSVYLDALALAVAQNPALDAKIDPTKAVTKGFSIGGKNAFVAALFDERVKAVVNGGAGATGPANWRYNAQGQEYDFTGTDYYAPGAEKIVAHGTEGPGNSYRHNRVRETELFRHFMPYGHMYAHEDGSYGYGGYSRLPFDQALLVATLAPDRAILINTNLNDYNDGAVTDNMSLQIAKGVYENLGVDADDFVKFNSGSYRSSGDPHGSADATPEGKYLSDLFYGTATLTSAEAARLDTDPYALPVSDGRTQSPYDYYWGGYNTITGGAGGVGGADGWYFAGFDTEMASLRAVVVGLGLGKGPTNALTTKLDQVLKLLAKGQPAQAAGVFDGFVTQLSDLVADGKLSAGQAAPLVAAAGQLILHINVTPDLRPAWSSSTVYDGGEQVTYQGGRYLASYWTQGQRPGDPSGPWQEIATDPSGVAIWTPSRIFTTGDVVTHQGRTWRAQWYTRNQVPGDPNGPWQEVAPQPPDGGPAAWTATTVYTAGDRVSYSGQAYEARWWTRNQPPSDPYGPWKPIG